MNNSYKCIKTSLKSIVKFDFVIDKIIQTSNLSNKIVSHSLQFLKLYLIHLYDNNLDFPIINKQFINAIMKTVCISSTTQGRKPSESTSKIKDDLKLFYNLHYKDIQGEELNYKNMNTILDYLAIDILTMYENNIKQHFIKYIERFVNVIWRKNARLKIIKEFKISSKLRKLLINNLNNQLRRIKNDLINQNQPMTSLKYYYSQINKEKLKILPNKIFKKNNVYYDLQCSPQDYLPCMFYMMKKIECDDEKIFNVCPLRSNIIPKYFRLDTTTLVNLLLTNKQGTKQFYKINGNLVKYQERLWNFFFKTKLKCFHLNNYKFHYMIETDGIGVSIILKQKDIEIKPLKDNTEKYIDELSERQYERIKNKNIVAIDPNMSDLIYCINDKGNTFRYTQNQRRKESKQKKYRDILQDNKENIIINNKNILHWEAKLSHHNKKTLNFIKFKEYIKQKNKLNIKLYPFYEQNLYRELKLYSYSNRKRSERKMINNFIKLYGSPNETIIGFGDFEQSQNRKFKEPTMGKGLRTLFKKEGYKVYLVDEFRTSARCSHCQNDEGICSIFKKCINPRPKKNNIILRHGLVKCSTCLRIWNRDYNASRNILKIVKSEIKGLGRPDYLKRGLRPNQ